LFCNIKESNFQVIEETNFIVSEVGLQMECQKKVFVFRMCWCDLRFCTLFTTRSVWFLFLFLFLFILWVVAFFVHNCCIFCWVFLNDWWLDLDIYKQMKLRYLFFQGVISEIESFLLVGAGEGND